MKARTNNTEVKTTLLYAESNRSTYTACTELSRSIRRGWGRLFLLLFILGLSTANAQVGIGTDDPDPSAIVEIDVSSLTGNKQGFVPPRMNTAQRNNISNPVPGLTIFNTEANSLQWFTDKAWYDLSEGNLTPGAESDCSTTGFIPPYLTADETVVKDLISPATGQTWMDRNLGAYNKARSSTDCWAYGNLYQWGRASDGHEFRGSPTHNADTDGFATTSVPNTGVNDWDGEFIFTTQSLDFSTPGDWLDPQDNTLWQGVNGTNNPCPAGYKVPSQAEMQLEVDDFSVNTAAIDAYVNLRLPVSGARKREDGSLLNPDVAGYYWTSEVFNTVQVLNLVFANGAIQSGTDSPTVRANGHAVRCIKD